MILGGLAGRAGLAVTGLRVLTQAGVVRPLPPWTLARVGSTVLRWGTGPAGGFTSLAVRFPHRTGLVDERGDLTFGELHRRTNAMAERLRARGVGPGDSIAIMCRNHRYFVEASVAAAKLGADVLYLNTSFAGPALREVLESEEPVALVYDEEFADAVGDAEVPLRLLAWAEEDPEDPGEGTLEALVRHGAPDDLAPPVRHSRVVILTSGTTGRPRGAARSEAGVDAAVAILERIPLRTGARMHVAAPLFHTWGFAHLALSMLLGSTLVLRRRFEPEEFLRVLQAERCTEAVVIPVMLQRVMALPEDVRSAYDLSDLRVVTSSGSALPGDLAVRWMDQYGDHLYSTYGSTEVAYAAIATPDQLRAHPATAGRPPVGTQVRILDEAGRPVPDGASGRIFVGNSLLFEGYTSGGGKEIVDGLMSSGDVGRFDEGLLYVEGRDDEMIVSGGENVFPQEVEHVLTRHEAVHEAAAIGVADEHFGQRLRAFVVVHSPVSEEALQEWVRQNLARYKVPREIHFLEELPRNATGKVLKQVLAARQEES